MHFDSTYRRFGLIISDEYESGTISGIKLSKLFSVIGYKLLNVHTFLFEDIYNEGGEHTFDYDEVGWIKYFGEESTKNKDGSESIEYCIGNSLDAMSGVFYPLPVYTRSGELYVSCLSDMVLYNLATLYAVVVNAKDLSVDIICRFAEPGKYSFATTKYLTNRFGGSRISPKSKNGILDIVSNGIYANDELCYVDSKDIDVVSPKNCKYIHIENICNAETLVLGSCAELLECIPSSRYELSRIKSVYMSRNASKELVGSYLYSVISVVYRGLTATSAENNLKYEVETKRELGDSKIYDICSKEEYKDVMKHILNGINIIIY